MPESKEEEDKRSLRELEAKNVAHYSTLLKAWIDTRMERDRTLVKLSAAGVGLLATLLTTLGVQYPLELFFYVCAFGGFFITIWAALEIYERNSVYIEDSIRGKPEKDTKLERYDRLSKFSFLIAAAFAIVIALGSAVNKTINKGGAQMSEDRSSKRSDQQQGVKQSIEGLQRLNPAGQEKKSLSGLGNLKPISQPPQSQPAQSTPSPSSGSSGANSSQGAKPSD